MDKLDGKAVRGSYVSSFLRCSSLTNIASSPPLLLKAAAYNGILTNNGQSQASSCATGNCSWPITPSVAICGGCVETKFSMSCNSTICAYHLPSGKTANLTNLTTLAGMGTGFQVFQSPGFYFDSTQADKLYLSNFEAVGMPAGTPLGIYSWQNKSDRAYECALWACVQAFETWQINSKQTQVVRRTWNKVDNSSLFIDNNLYSNITFVDLPEEMNVPSGANFSFESMAAGALMQFFELIFDGNISVNQGTQISSSDVVQALYNATGDLDTWMQNVASSLTNVVRSFDPAPRRAVLDGIGYQLEYDVRWPWIIFVEKHDGTREWNCYG